MKSLKILIVEDDNVIRQNLEEQLREFGYVISGSVGNSDSAIRNFKSKQPDLAILDINLGEKSTQNGIELAQTLNNLAKVPIIFLTSYFDEHTRIQAKAANPAHFLIKPCSKAQLDVAIDFAMDKYFRSAMDPTIPASQRLYCPMNMEAQFFFVKSRDKYVRIEVADIQYMKGGGSATIIQTSLGKHVHSANLGKTSAQIGSSQLVRVQKSYVVNINQVKSMDDSTLYFDVNGNTHFVPMGREYKTEALQKLKRLKT